jgi:hypothetical protein
LDTADANGGYTPLISGDDAKYPAPYVLTANTAGANLTTQALKTNPGAAAGAQKWKTAAGPIAAGVIRDPNWAGQIAGVNAQNQVIGAQFTEEQAEWVVPTLACSQYNDQHHHWIAAWVGLGGDGSGPFVQTGVQDQCNPPSLQNLTGQTDTAWWEVPPYDAKFLTDGSHPVHPGDTMYAEVLYTGAGTGDTYPIELKDLTQGWNFGVLCPSVNCTVNGTAVGIPSGYPGTAESIVERELGPFAETLTFPLPDFTPIPFSDVHYEWAGTAPLGAGGFPVYVLEPPPFTFLPPEIYVDRTPSSWTVYWEARLWRGGPAGPVQGR